MLLLEELQLALRVLVVRCLDVDLQLFSRLKQVGQGGERGGGVKLKRKDRRDGNGRGSE